MVQCSMTIGCVTVDSSYIYLSKLARANTSTSTTTLIPSTTRSLSLPHRCEFVAEIDGVRFYNDSKGTNVGASVSAIEGLAESGKIVLIAGGLAKGGEFSPLAEAMRRSGRAAVVIGEAAAAIEACLAEHVPCRREQSMAAAVQGAFAFAQTGDVVLLSPACASFDMFRSYSDRGEQFSAAVRELAHG